jgi:tetratricopeptide (TPR) repeat protein
MGAARTVSGWRLRMLGGFRLEHDGQVVAEFSRRRQDALLALVALRPGVLRSRVSVARELWPEKTQRLSLNRLTEVLTLLNRQLAAADVGVQLVDARYHEIGLGPHVHTDVQEFEQVMASAVAERDPGRRATYLAEAIALHGVGLLPVLDDPWVVAERQRLAEVRDKAAATLAELVAYPGVAEQQQPAGRLSAVEVGRYLASTGRWQGDGAPRVVVGAEAGGRETEAAGEEPDDGRPLARLSGRALVAACVALAERAEPNLDGPDRRIWLERLDADWPTIAEGIEWAISHDLAEPAMRLTAALWRYWYTRSRIDEGRWNLNRALTLPTRREGPVYAKAANAAGALALQDGDLAYARRRFGEALAIWQALQNVEAIGRVAANLGTIAYKQGDLEEGRRQYAMSLEVLRTHGSTAAVAGALRNAALVEIADGHPEAAEALLSERIDIGRQLKNADIVAWGLVSLAGVLQGRGQWDRAEAMLQEALPLLEDLRDLRGLASCFRSMGYCEQMAGRLDAARVSYEHSLSLCRTVQDVRGVGESLRYLASVAEAQGDAEEARRQYQQALLLLENASDAQGSEKARRALEALNVVSETPAGREE